MYVMYIYIYIYIYIHTYIYINIYIYIYIYIYIFILEMIRRKTTICLILQDMFRIHHPSSVANTE